MISFDICFSACTLDKIPQMSGTTLGVIGYGDIGRAAAVKAKAMGMKIIAQRRRPELSQGDGIADQVLGAGQVKKGRRKSAQNLRKRRRVCYYLLIARTIILQGNRVCCAEGAQENLSLALLSSLLM